MPVLVSLFRTVQLEELQDLRTQCALRTVESSIEGKMFWTTREDAERFSRLLQRTGIGPSWIVEVRLTSAALRRLTSHVLDGRPARFVAELDLDWFNDLVMELVMPTTKPQDESNV